MKCIFSFHHLFVSGDKVCHPDAGFDKGARVTLRQIRPHQRWPDPMPLKKLPLQIILERKKSTKVFCGTFT